MKSAKIILSALAGVAIGIQIGLLIAPEKGEDTRKRLSKKGEDYLKDLNSQLNTVMHGVHEKMDKLNKNIASVAEETKARSNELLSQAKEKI